MDKENLKRAIKAHIDFFEYLGYVELCECPEKKEQMSFKGIITNADNLYEWAYTAQTYLEMLINEKYE